MHSHSEDCTHPQVCALGSYPQTLLPGSAHTVTQVTSSPDTPQPHPTHPSPLNSSQGVRAASRGEDGRGGLITGLLPFQGLASSLPASGPASDSTPGQRLPIPGPRASSFKSLVCCLLLCPLLSCFPGIEGCLVN
ncbi:unnamed protein product [Rangifer tarandus platyrhynchus]|uniref:Uncharacterized protein n=1 Tax=Rangifer tarandus platyrhynchus TaxID=3082113 RepID=A0ABN8YMQ6_RANTA|nr:unnamed protein product [Rangifer tarandus platyrhynchus]